ncbi:MAG: penicillin-binding protein A [Oscillospiraceae bacterium]|nr:penicillin-binding protein A [Oscillospiraceae bacterium]
MKQNPAKPRLIGLAVLFGLFLLLFFGTLYNYQIVHGREYLARSITSNATAREVEASRGILTDRNGKVLVSNRLTYTLTFSREHFSGDEDLNAAILQLIRLCRDNGIVWNDSFPVSLGAPFSYTSKIDENENFLSFLRKRNLSESIAAADLIASLRTAFSIDTALSPEDARALLGVRYELVLRPSYLFADDVPVELISQIVDGQFPGVTPGTSSARTYNTPYAAHILGRISRIYAEDWDKYKDLGYSMDALVGLGGVEQAFESDLHGVNGTRLITTDNSGKITGEVYTKAPQPGHTVELTLDIDLQEDTEHILAQTIEGMIDKDSEQRGGAAAVVQVGTGEVLALASYPTYNLSTFDQDYNDLLHDSRLPMFNRAVDGIYAPGSTFKPCTAVAALESGIITPSTTVRDRGIYTYYAYPQPMCWIYRQGGGTHGNLNVSRAITESCNYFFYEVGRLMGIDVLDDYATQFGLGQHTGIEIGDNSGALASPAYAESHGLDWSDGQTITAAIGQSYNLFTPLQLANYIATLASHGQHCAAHLLKNVRSYDNTRLIRSYDEDPLNVVSMSDSTVQAVLSGMHDLTVSGSVAPQFSRCTVSAGAKTGTAQVGTEINNGVFVAFAPYENPEIAVAVVIEKGGSGAALADTAVAIINSYFAAGGSDAVTGENTLLK